MTIAVLCPSRGNPQALRDAFLSFHDTTLSRFSRFVAVIDHDDPTLKDYVAMAEDTISLLIDVVPPERSGWMNSALNYSAERWAQRDDIIGFIGDDHRFRTKGWDRTIETVMDKVGGGFAYGDDLFQGEKLPTAIFISSSVVRALGWFAPPKQRHLYLDDAWKTLGDATDSLYYLPDVVIEHMHPAAGKGEWDPNHVRVNSGEMYQHDRVAYGEWINGEYAKDVETVREVLGKV
jgi:hypothetical protein